MIKSWRFDAKRRLWYEERADGTRDYRESWAAYMNDRKLSGWPSRKD